MFNYLFFLLYRNEETTIRYFRVLSNTIERSRAAPISDCENDQTESNKKTPYVPSMRQKV